MHPGVGATLRWPRTGSARLETGGSRVPPDPASNPVTCPPAAVQGGPLQTAVITGQSVKRNHSTVVAPRNKDLRRESGWLKAQCKIYGLHLTLGRVDPSILVRCVIHVWEHET